MYKYRNEAHFSRALCRAFTAKGIFYQRIETGATGIGVPDIYAVLPSIGPCWLELKLVRKICPQEGPVTLTVRPSQRAWMRRQMKAGGIPCYAVTCFLNTVLWVPMDLVKDNLIIIGKDVEYGKLQMDVFG